MVIQEPDPAKRALVPRSSGGTADVALYRVAYEQSERALDDQTDELNGIRSRAVSFLTFVGAATAFLVGTTVTSATKDALFYTVASLGTLLVVVCIICIFVVLKPSRMYPWQSRLSGEVLVKDWIDGTDVPSPNEAQIVRALALQYDEMRKANEALLGSIRRWYIRLIACGIAQLAVWISLAWLKG